MISLGSLLTCASRNPICFLKMIMEEIYTVAVHIEILEALGWRYIQILSVIGIKTGILMPKRCCSSQDCIVIKSVLL